MKKKIFAMLLGLVIASASVPIGVSAAPSGETIITYTTPAAPQTPDGGATIIETGAGRPVQTGDTSSSAWIYSLVMAGSTLAILAILLGKNRERRS